MPVILRYSAIYGLLSGAVIIAVILAGIMFSEQLPFLSSVWMGYLVMLIALTVIFVGVKRYRDIERGGVIGFLNALGVGLAMAVVAALAYVVVWEIYLAATDYAFMDMYVASSIEGLRDDGLSAAELASRIESLEQMREQYRSPLFRVPVTFVEIFPVGLIVSLVSAVLLRNPRVFPATR